MLSFSIVITCRSLCPHVPSNTENNTRKKRTSLNEAMKKRKHYSGLCVDDSHFVLTFRSEIQQFDIIFYEDIPFLKPYEIPGLLVYHRVRNIWNFDLGVWGIHLVLRIEHRNFIIVSNNSRKMWEKFLEIG